MHISRKNTLTISSVKLFIRMVIEVVSIKYDVFIPFELSNHAEAIKVGKRCNSLNPSYNIKVSQMFSSISHLLLI